MESQCTAIQPRRLKDFLQDQNLPFPHTRTSTLSRQFSILRRSISRRFSIKSRSTSLRTVSEPTMTRTTSVTVKDILRWRSFRDLADVSDPVEIDVSPVPEYSPESPRCTVTATTTSAGTPRSSSCSSWCDSDITGGDSPVCFRLVSGEPDVGDKKSFHINIAGGDRNIRDLKDQVILVEEDEQQFSPISVLDFTQDEETSPFHQILANMERRNIMLKQRIQDFENVIKVDDDMNKYVELKDTKSFIIEEKAIRLMEQVKTTSSSEEWDLSLDFLLLDYFRDELIASKEAKSNVDLESRVLNAAKSWVRGEDDRSLEWEMEGRYRREVCIREMDKGLNWKDFEDDQNEIVIEMEKMMLNQLLDELSIDLVNV